MTDHATPALTLYHSPHSRSTITRWMLEEVGAPYDLVVLDLNAGEQLTPAYRAINPMGKVPALRHGETVITEVAAICFYLADAFPAAGLAPGLTEPLRGPYLKWMFFGPSCIEPAVIVKAMGWEGGRRGMLGWADFDTTVETVAAAVAKGPYILGDRFSAADVVIGAQVRWGLLFQTLPQRPEFTAYVQRLEARPALQRQIALDAALLAKAAGGA